jgi:hypothetical protein
MSSSAIPANGQEKCEGNLLSVTDGERQEKSYSESDPVEFLAKFAYQDLSAMREGDWLNLRADMEAFAQQGSGGLELHPEAPLALPPEDKPQLRKLGSLQTCLRELLQPVAVSQSRIEPASPASKIFKESASGSFNSSREVGIGVSSRGRAAPSLFLAGEYLHLFYVKAALLLYVTKEPSVKRLRLCTECHRVFLRVRKQIYCSRRCVNRANMRAWLARPHGKASHRASSKRSWVYGKPRQKSTVNPNRKNHRSG